MTTLLHVTRKMQYYLRTRMGGRIVEAPDEPPSHVTDFPMSITFPKAGLINWEYGYGGKLGIHNIQIEVHIGLMTLEEAVIIAVPLIEDIPNVLMERFLNDDQWGGLIDHFEDITYEGPMPLGYGGLETVGVKFTVQGLKITGIIS